MDVVEWSDAADLYVMGRERSRENPFPWRISTCVLSLGLNLNVNLAQASVGFASPARQVGNNMRTPRERCAMMSSPRDRPGARHVTGSTPITRERTPDT